MNQQLLDNPAAPTAHSPVSGPPAAKGATGIRRVVRAAAYWAAGLRYAYTHEAAFRQELLLLAILAPLAF